MADDIDPDDTGEFETTVTDALRKYSRGKMSYKERHNMDRRKNDKLTFKDWIGLVGVFVLPLAGTFLANHIAIIRLQDGHVAMLERQVEDRTRLEKDIAELKAWNLSIMARLRQVEIGD